MKKKDLYTKNTRKRFLKVITVFSKLFLSFRKEFKLVKSRGFKYAQTKMAPVHEKRAQELYDLASNLGGVLIKLCQYFSTRRDIFPEAYIKTLAPLQDNVPPIGFDVVEGVLKSQYSDYKKIFSYISPDPLASASLGQTHKATLSSGQEVVLKILKPDVERVIDIDFAIIYYVFRIFSNFEFFKRQGDFFTLLDEFIRVTGDELNFKREAYIAKRFREYFLKYDFIKIPHVYDEFSTDKIIVMEFMYGDKITEKEKWLKRNNDSKTIIRNLLRVYLDQFIYFKTIHFDPHPGNIFVNDNNQITLIDYGMSGEITEKMRDGIKTSLKAFIAKDYHKILETLEDLGFIRKGANKYVFIPVMEYFFDDIMETVTLEREALQGVDVQPILDELVEIVYTQPMNLPVEWAFIGRTLGTLVGIVAGLNPDFNLYNELKPYTDEIVKSNAKEIVESTIDMVKEQSKILFGLPKKADLLIEKVQRGQLKFKLDFADVDERIDDIKQFIIKAIAFGVSVIFGLASYVMYLFDRPIQSIILAAITAFSFSFSLFFRKRSMKDEIRRNMSMR